jgi:pteridine reductase
MGNHTLNRFNTQASKVALITGGGRRKGAAIVKTLHQAGYKVAIHCLHSLKDAHDLAQSLNQQHMNSAYVLQGELAQADTSSTLIAMLEDWSGRLDLLVNNASVFIKDEIILNHPSQWDSLFSINLKAPFHLSLAARDLLAKQQGSIVNITDVHAEKPLKGYGIYCQSKAALEMQTKSLAKEFAPLIRVNAVAPGAIAWPEHNNCLSPAQQEKIIAQTPLKRHGHPQCIGQAVLALAENPFITGQIMRVDGGRHL